MKYIKYGVVGLFVVSLTGCGLAHFVFHDDHHHDRHEQHDKDKKSDKKY